MKTWIATIFVIFVFTVLIAWMLTYLHRSRVYEGFVQVRSEQKSVALVKALKQAESFSDGSAQSLAPPASLQQQRKTSVYLETGLITFIGYESDVQYARDNYLIFFQPTQADLQCDFTNVRTPLSCISPLDTISANDNAITIPVSVQAYPPYAVSAPNADADTRVYILGSVYNFLRVSVKARCWAAPSAAPAPSGAPAVKLALPRGDYVTKLIMLLRPTYIRATASGVAASMLYWVQWHMGDGVTYESQGQDNAELELVQVTGYDHTGMIDPVTDLPPIDVVINGGTTLRPIDSAREIDIPIGSTTSLVLYYPKYMMPSPMGLKASGDLNPQQVGTVYASVVTGAFVSLADQNGKIVINVMVPSGHKSIATVTVPAAGNTRFSVPIPSGSPAYVVACAYHNVVTLAVMTPSGTTVSSMQLVTYLNYRPGQVGTVTYGGGAKEINVGKYNSTSIPNYADIALSLGCLPLPPSVPFSGVAAVEKFEGGSPPKLLLKQGESLQPGQSISSASGKYVAIYQLDGQLAVYETDNNVMIWSTGLASTSSGNVTPGSCTLGKDGVLRLTAGGINRSQPMSIPYWVSTTGAAPGADQAPFSLMVVDSPPGQLNIVGKFSATPVWVSQ